MMNQNGCQNFAGKTLHYKVEKSNSPFAKIETDA